LCAVEVLLHDWPAFEEELAEGAHRFGRGDGNEVRLDNDTVSEFHFEMRVGQDAVMVATPERA
jgi:hypothetical protein